MCARNVPGVAQAEPPSCWHACELVICYRRIVATAPVYTMAPPQSPNHATCHGVLRSVLVFGHAIARSHTVRQTARVICCQPVHSLPALPRLLIAPIFPNNVATTTLRLENSDLLLFKGARREPEPDQAIRLQRRMHIATDSMLCHNTTLVYAVGVASVQ